MNAKPLAATLRLMGQASGATPDETAAFEQAAASVERLYPQCPEVVLVGFDGTHPAMAAVLGLERQIEGWDDQIRQLHDALDDVKALLTATLKKDDDHG